MFARFMKASLFVAAASAASAAVISPAVAAPNLIVRTAMVSYADLDLGTEAGVATLDTRIRTAVRDVCGSVTSPGLRANAEVRECRKDALASARRATVEVLAQVNSGERLAQSEGAIAVGGR